MSQFQYTVVPNHGIFIPTMASNLNQPTTTANPPYQSIFQPIVVGPQQQRSIQMPNPSFPSIVSVQTQQRSIQIPAVFGHKDFQRFSMYIIWKFPGGSSLLFSVSFIIIYVVHPLILPHHHHCICYLDVQLLVFLSFKSFAIHSIKST